MGKTEQQRQRKLAKKQAKEKNKRKEIVRAKQALSSLAGKMQAASHGRILHCSVGDSIRHSGIGYVAFARQYPTGETAIAHVLLDTYCLGVKDIAAQVCSHADALSRIKIYASRGSQDVSPGLARGLVEAAIDYAGTLGFSPHPDYRKVAPLWGDTPAESVTGLYEFGKNGRPFYINGPFDDSPRQQSILRTLEQNVGTGNFDVMIRLPTMEDEIGTPFTDSEEDLIEEGLEDEEDDARFDNDHLPGENEYPADHLLDAHGNVIRRLDVSDDSRPFRR
ncbi:MAG: hypothetical protein O2931_08420 [Planctomycetota bacterium]|nr:hypothetical protein [Planctomycetota bacterium]